MATATQTFDLRLVIGRAVLNALAEVGRVALMMAEFFRGLSEVRVWFPRMMTEAWNIGVGSLFIVLLVSSFAGAVTALQAGYQFQGNLPWFVVGTLVSQSIILELGPVLTGLILAGRIGARYAAELGTMRVTEQIDALESLGRSPASHLIVPRVLAGLIMIPALTVFADIIGVATGWFAARQVMPVTDADFAYGVQAFYRPFDAYYSLIKSFFFGASITIISCSMGMNTGQGAEGVGRSTTGAVVTSSVLILLLDTLLANLLLNQ
jgi:phospholipid/cholesterol/gamma-HCH transport system permease protein